MKDRSKSHEDRKAVLEPLGRYLTKEREYVKQEDVPMPEFMRDKKAMSFDLPKKMALEMITQLTAMNKGNSRFNYNELIETPQMSKAEPVRKETSIAEQTEEDAEETYGKRVSAEKSVTDLDEFEQESKQAIVDWITAPQQIDPEQPEYVA